MGAPYFKVSTCRIGSSKIKSIFPVLKGGGGELGDLTILTSVKLV